MYTIINDVGDLLAAIRNSNKPVSQGSSIRFSGGLARPKISFVDPKEESRRQALDLVMAHIRKYGPAFTDNLDRLIALVQVKLKLDQQSVIAMPIQDFLDAIPDDDSNKNELLLALAASLGIATARKKQSGPSNNTKDGMEMAKGWLDWKKWQMDNGLTKKPSIKGYILAHAAIFPGCECKETLKNYCYRIQQGVRDLKKHGQISREH